MPMLLMAFWIVVGLFAPLSTLDMLGGVPWQAPQLLLTYSALPLTADAAVVGAVTLMVLLAVAAAAQDALPLWAATRVQLPADTSVTALLVTVQTRGVVDSMLTGRAEVALAASAGVATPSV